MCVFFFFYTRPWDTVSVGRLWKSGLSRRRSEQACREVGLGRAHRCESDRGDLQTRKGGEIVTPEERGGPLQHVRLVSRV